MNRLTSLRKTLTALTAGFFIYAGCGSEEEQSLVDCLVEKNVRLYTAYWCVPCHQQEDLLEEALGEEWGYFKENAVVQCYEEYKLTQECDEKNIGAYPAWEFPQNGPAWAYGVQSLEEIAAFAGCEYNQ